MIFTDISQEEYDKFASNYEPSYYLQGSMMKELNALRNYKDIYVGIKDKSKLLGAARIIYKEDNALKKKKFYAIRGPLLNYNNKGEVLFFTKECKKYLKSIGGYMLLINPPVVYQQRDGEGNIIPNGENNGALVKFLKNLGYRHMGFSTLDMSRELRFEYCLDIENKSVSEIYNGFKSNHRNHINKADKNGLFIKELDYDELPIYFNIVNDTAKRKNFSHRNLEYYQTLYNVLVKKGKAKFVVAFLDTNNYFNNLENEKEVLLNKLNEMSDSGSHRGEQIDLKNKISNIDKRICEDKKLFKKDDIVPVAGSLFIFYNKTIYYVYSGSYLDYIHLFGQYKIQWYIIKYGIEHKYTKYNFMGIDGKFIKGTPEYGVYEFKRGFGGYVVEYIGDFELPLSWKYYLLRVKNKIKKIIKR